VAADHNKGPAFFIGKLRPSEEVTTTHDRIPYTEPVLVVVPCQGRETH
jgi:hypothetical protein